MIKNKTESHSENCFSDLSFTERNKNDDTEQAF